MTWENPRATQGLEEWLYTSCIAVLSSRIPPFLCVYIKLCGPSGVGKSDRGHPGLRKNCRVYFKAEWCSIILNSGKNENSDERRVGTDMKIMN